MEIFAISLFSQKRSTPRYGLCENATKPIDQDRQAMLRSLPRGFPVFQRHFDRYRPSPSSRSAAIPPPDNDRVKMLHPLYPYRRREIDGQYTLCSCGRFVVIGTTPCHGDGSREAPNPFPGPGSQLGRHPVFSFLQNHSRRRLVERFPEGHSAFPAKSLVGILSSRRHYTSHRLTYLSL
jgi:hypothetical protein